MILEIAFALTAAASVSGVSNFNKNAEVSFAWKEADFTYPSTVARETAKALGAYTPRNIVILDASVYPGRNGGRRVFVSLPRFNTGIPATVAAVTREKSGRNILLEPFPDWESQSIVDCGGPVSVYRTHIDRCGLLWVLDTGRVDIFTNPRRACQPKVLVYDLNNGDRLIARHEFPDGVVSARSNLANLVTDSRAGNCSDSFAYIADVNDPALVVFELQRNASWRVHHNYMHPDPMLGTFEVAGVTIDLLDGILGLALGPLLPNGDRRLYMHAVSSRRVMSVLTSVLKNTRSSGDVSAQQLRDAFDISPEGREGPATLAVVTEGEVLLYASLTDSQIVCWDIRSPFTKGNLRVLYKDAENLQFISGMKLVGNELWLTSSKLQNYIEGTYDADDVKYRLVVVRNIGQLIKDAGCRGSSDYVPGKYTKFADRKNVSNHNQHHQHPQHQREKYHDNPIWT